jgi:hypothetical protein
MGQLSSAAGWSMKMPHPAMAFNTIFCGFHMTKPHPLVDKTGK